MKKRFRPFRRLRNIMSLWFIRLARRCTSWGFTDDHLAVAEKEQIFFNKEFY